MRKQGWGRTGRTDEQGDFGAQVCGWLVMKEEDTSWGWGNKERWKEIRGKPVQYFHRKSIPFSCEMQARIIWWGEGIEEVRNPTWVRLGGLKTERSGCSGQGFELHNCWKHTLHFSHLRELLGTTELCVQVWLGVRCVTHWVTSTPCYHFLSLHCPMQVATGRPWGQWGHALNMLQTVLFWRILKGIWIL